MDCYWNLASSFTTVFIMTLLLKKNLFTVAAPFFLLLLNVNGGVYAQQEQHSVEESDGSLRRRRGLQQQASTTCPQVKPVDNFDLWTRTPPSDGSFKNSRKRPTRTTFKLVCGPSIPFWNEKRGPGAIPLRSIIKRV